MSLDSKSYYIPSESEVLSFYGEFKELSNRTRQAWAQITHKQFGPSEIQCRLLFDRPWDESRVITDLNNRNLEIKTEAPHRRQIYLKGIGSGTYERAEANFTIGGYDILPMNTEVPAGAKVRAIVHLTQRGLLGVRRHLGFEPREEEEDNTISWTTDNETYRFYIATLNERVTAGQDRAHLTRERPCLTKAFTTSAHTNLTTILDLIEAELTDILRLLSFLSREWVEWFGISVTAEWPLGNTRQFTKAIRREQIWERRPVDGNEDPLLDESALLDGTFSRILSALLSSPLKKALKRTMAYSLSSRHGPGDESDFLLAFAALETLINALDDQDPLLPQKDIAWNALSKSLKKCIDEHGKARNLPAEKILLIRDKISELRRPPVIDRMMFHLTRLTLETGDLWQNQLGSGSNFKNGLSTAISQRNDLVHATTVEDFGSMRRNFVRIQLLFERLVLRILGYTDRVSSRDLGNVHWQEEWLQQGEE